MGYKLLIVYYCYYFRGISSVKRKHVRDSSSGSEEVIVSACSSQSAVPVAEAQANKASSVEIDVTEECHVNDVGRYVGRASQLSVEKKGDSTSSVGSKCCL